jgi:HSP20 family protein
VQIQVTVSEGMVTIKGEMKEEAKQEEKNSLRREFHYGAFTRTVPLPAGVQAEKATAQLKDGMLEVTIPKSAEARVKAIPIRV